MPIIPSRYIEVNETGEDILSYFRSFYNTTNPHEKGIITIKASSTFPGDGSNRSDASTILRGDDLTRWVSQSEKNASFTIDFHYNFVSLSAYTIVSIPGRYIKNWDVFGINNGKKYLIDRRINASLCEDMSCSQEIVKTFYCQFPGAFNKFKFVLTGVDSNRENFLSMSYLKFFGIVSPNHYFVTYQMRCSKHNYVIALALTLII